MSPMFNHLNIGLKEYDLLHVSQDKEPIIDVELNQEYEPRCCLRCFHSRILSKGKYVRKVRHLSSFGRFTQLRVHTRRFQCLGCNASFVAPLPGITKGKHSSEPFRNTIYQDHHHGICARTLAKTKALGEATIGRIYKEFTQRKANERISLNCPAYLGIDEHTLHKGQRFCTTFCDIKNHRIFEIQPGRSNSDLASFLSKLKGRHKVKLVCIDLSSPYRRLVRKWFPNAKIVADRFHVVRLIYHHLLTLARAAVPQLKHHKGALAALRKRPENLKPKQKQRLQELLETYPILKPIYEKMHTLRNLMNHKGLTKKQSKPAITQLLNEIQQLKAEGSKPLRVLANTLESWAEEIVCMWRFRKNNGITEGFHRKMKLIQRRAYGFKNFENYRLRVIAQCG